MQLRTDRKFEAIFAFKFHLHFSHMTLPTKTARTHYAIFGRLRPLVVNVLTLHVSVHAIT